MVKKTFSLIVIVCFFLTTLGPFPQVHADAVLGLPAPGTMINLSPAYEPVMIKGLTIHKDNPFLFDFIVDVGQDRISGEPLKKEGEKLIKYFLASLAIPDKDIWVNLSPYEKNRMIPEALGQTDMGRDLLEQDYILKQITASLIYPEKNLGKKFWDKVYAKAQAMYGTTQIPVNTFNKVWIMADKATIYEHNQTAFVIDGHLKVMLEEDYLALTKHQRQPGDMALAVSSSTLPSGQGLNAKASQVNNVTHNMASQIVRQIILPELEKEVNTGKNFANLRQIFNSIILASWYKKNLKEALLNQVYADKSKVRGVVVSGAKQSRDQIYEQYLKAYKKGVFNYIKEDINTANGETIPRKYFSGGFGMGLKETVITDDQTPGNMAMISGAFNRIVSLIVLSTVFINPLAAKPRTQRQIHKAEHKIEDFQKVNPISGNRLSTEVHQSNKQFKFGIKVRGTWVRPSLSRFWELRNPILYLPGIEEPLKNVTWIKASDDGQSLTVGYVDADHKEYFQIYNYSFFTRAFSEASDPAMMAVTAYYVVRGREGAVKLIAEEKVDKIDSYLQRLTSQLNRNPDKDNILTMLRKAARDAVLERGEDNEKEAIEAGLWDKDNNSLDTDVGFFINNSFRDSSIYRGPIRIKIPVSEIERHKNNRLEKVNELIAIEGKLVLRSRFDSVMGKLSLLHRTRGGDKKEELILGYLNAWAGKTEKYTRPMRDEHGLIKEDEGIKENARQLAESIQLLKPNGDLGNDEVLAIVIAATHRPKGDASNSKAYFVEPINVTLSKKDVLMPLIASAAMVVGQKLSIEEIEKILKSAENHDTEITILLKKKGWNGSVTVASKSGKVIYKDRVAVWLGSGLRLPSMIELEDIIDIQGVTNLELSAEALLQVHLIRLLSDEQLAILGQKSITDKKKEEFFLIKTLWLMNNEELNRDLESEREAARALSYEAEINESVAFIRSTLSNNAYNSLETQAAGNAAMIGFTRRLAFGVVLAGLPVMGQNSQTAPTQHKPTVTKQEGPIIKFKDGVIKTGDILYYSPIKDAWIKIKVIAIVPNGHQVFSIKYRIILGPTTGQIDFISGFVLDNDENQPKWLTKEDKSQVSDLGGIDLNTSNGMQWKVSKDGNGVEMNIDPAMIARIRREGIDGLSPVILKMTPVSSIWSLVGIQAPVAV